MDVCQLVPVCAADAFETTDGKYLDQNTNTSKDDGCTAVTAVLIGQKLYVANVGDSRAILCRGGEGENTDCTQRCVLAPFPS